MVLLLLSCLWLVHTFSPLVNGFNFSIGPVGECDPLTLSWSGGQSPFQLLIIPPGGTMANITIPASAYNKSSKQGSYTLPQLKVAEEKQIILSMSDATGIFAGGTSSQMSVGASQSGQSCNTTFPNPDFTFSLDSNLAQCSPYPVILYPGTVTPVLPVRLLVNIPQGQSFVVTLSLDLSSWIANLTAGTSAVFTVLDARNKNGGTESLRDTAATNNTSCLVSSSSTTAGNPQPTLINTTALAVGISMGGVVIICIVLIFFLYRRKRQSDTRARSFLDFSGSPVDPDSSYHMINRCAPSKVRSTQPTMMLSPDSRSPPIWPSPPRTTESHAVSAYSPRSAGVSEHHPSDVVMHVDITETTRSPVEIPPGYSATLPPIPRVLLRDLTNLQIRV